MNTNEQRIGRVEAVVFTAVLLTALVAGGGFYYYVSGMVAGKIFDEMIPEMEAVAEALESYKADHGNYPLSLLPSHELPLSLTTPTAYLDKIPVDQLNDDLLGGHQSTYRYFGWGDYFVLLSHGPDNDGDIDAAQAVHSLLLEDYLTSDTSLSRPDREFLINSLYSWKGLGYNQENGRFSQGDIIFTQDGQIAGPINE